MNMWRYVEYQDDGVSVYQCLSCKETWTCTFAPGWLEWYQDEITLDVPIYHARWNHCPYCGTKWEHKVPGVYHPRNERMLGPKRLRQWLAIDSDWNKRVSQWKRGEKQRCWAIEEYSSGQWVVDQQLSLSVFSAQDIQRALKYERDICPFREYRARITEANASYIREWK